jgi:hypothetical protein
MGGRRAFCSGLGCRAIITVRAARHEASLAAGALMVLAVLTGMGVSSISYLVTWPTVAGMLVLAFGVLGPRRTGNWRKARPSWQCSERRPTRPSSGFQQDKA